MSCTFYDMFVNEQRPLQAKDLCSLFYVNFSPQGSNRGAKENQTICYWRDWLIVVEEGETDGVTLEMIMEFATGASTVPPLAFPHRPEIEFLQSRRENLSRGQYLPHCTTTADTHRI